MDNSAVATPAVVSQPPLATQLQQSHSQESFAANLRTLSDSLSAFQHCFTDLQRHIHSIQTSINSLLQPPPSTPLPASSSSPLALAPAPAPAPSPAPAPAPESEPEPEPSWESDPSEDLEEEEEVNGEEKEVEKDELGEGQGQEVESPRSELKSPRSELEIFCETVDNREGKGEGEEVKSPRPEVKSHGSELEIMCETMDNQGLCRYMITNISDIPKLREQVPKALKLSPNPATLVYKCIGKFYVKKGKRYVKDSPFFRERKAKVLLLEFLLMTGIYDDDKGIEIEKRMKDEAEQSALNCLRRMYSEGGILKAQEIDARGVLLLIGCFGIPSKFRNADIRDLLLVSNLKWILNALRRSNFLMAKFPEIIEEMVASKAVVKAVHIAYSVGMQDIFNPRKLLTTFLRESKKSFDRTNGSQGVHQGNIGVKRKYLSDLKSVIKCLSFHEIDPSKLLPGWQINMRIMSLEKDIAEFNRQIADQRISKQNAGLLKRKIDETVWLSNKQVKHTHFSNPWPPQHQGIVKHVVSNNNLFEGGGTAGQNCGYFMPPLVLHGPVAGSIHENVVGSLVGTVGGAAIGGPGAGISASADNIHAGMDVVPQGGSYAGGHGGSRLDSIPGKIRSHTGQLYGYAYSPSPCLEGPNTITGDTYRPASFAESSKGLPNTIAGGSNRPPPHLEVSPGLPNNVTSNAYRPAPYIESSKGLPDTIPPPYQFANTVPRTELNQSSGSQAVDAHPSSSLYSQR
ncbi:unnamed protein product [Withania somnifera]